MPDILSNIGNTAIGAGMGLLLEGHNDRRQLEQQRRLQALQIQGQQQMANYNYAQQLQMWKATGPQAQMQQLKEAGLNPALMYKQGGAGGTTGSPSGNVQGATAPAGGMELMNIMMQRTQMELLKAQTEKTKAEAGAIPTTIAKEEATIENIKADTNNKQVQKEILEAENQLKSTEIHIAEATMNDAIAMARTQLRTFTAQMHQAETENRITQETADNNIKIMAAEYAGILLKNDDIRKGVELKSEQIVKIKEDIKLAIEELKIKERHIVIAELQHKWETGYGSLLHNAADKILGIVPSLVERRGTKGRHK